MPIGREMDVHFVGDADTGCWKVRAFRKILQKVVERFNMDGQYPLSFVMCVAWVSAISPLGSGWVRVLAQ